jgi:peptidoglycan/xylan/chitin deacetylase (PgdA/CDA1 family)
MKSNPITVAASAKGPRALYGRALGILGRYGLTPTKMDQALSLFCQVLEQFGCGASFPITAVALKRHPKTIQKYINKNIEFAVHGYSHVDYTALSLDTQMSHMSKSKRIFSKMQISPSGFRSPYLSGGGKLNEIIRKAGFSYVSNQSILWQVMNLEGIQGFQKDSFQRALAFYNPISANEWPSVPQIVNKLVEIPVSLPDDEILLDRLGGENDFIVKVWSQILYETYQRGELFTLQLHPERIRYCANALTSVLAEARTFQPSVWIARLDEITDWWNARYRSKITVTEDATGGFQCDIEGPQGTTVLTRNVDLNVISLPWSSMYRMIDVMNFTIRSSVRPFIGVSPSTSALLVDFLIQQGYIIEISENADRYSYYFDYHSFNNIQAMSLLSQIEQCQFPLVRLGRWPYGAKSALAITGDIDALSLWDYFLRFIGK